MDFEFTKFMSQISLNKYLSFSIGQHMEQHSSVSQKIVNDGQSALQNILQLLTFDVLPSAGNLLVSLGVLFFVNIYLGFIALIFTIVQFFLFLWDFRRAGIWQPLKKVPALQPKKPVPTD